MGKKSQKAPVINHRKNAIIVCLVTIFLSNVAEAASSELTEINNNLQTIFKSIKQKYANHNAQQLALAAQTEAAKVSLPNTAPSQTFDSSSSIVTDNSVSDTELTNAPTDTTSRFSAGEELILSVWIDGQEMTSIFAIKSEQGLKISLSDFLQIVEIPIYVNTTAVSAEGWYQSEKNRFNLTRQPDGHLAVTLGSSRYKVATDDYIMEADLLVELNEISRWFELSYELNEETLKLSLSAKDKLPIQQRLERLNKPPITAGINTQSIMPLQKSGYQAFSPPMLDVQTWVQEAEMVTPPPVTAPAGTEPQKDHITSANYSILANHDLAFLNTELFLAGNKNDSLSDAWLTFSRQSDSGDLLGPLGATEYAFGDIVPVNAGFGNTLAMSRGLSLGNTPINQLADNRKVNITGEIQVGWDVELYRNGVLIDQRLGVSEGRYEFNDTLLDYGNNDFELIFYGPQGQRETKTESYLVEGNTVSAGQGMYRFSLVEAGESVFNVTPYADDPTQRGLIASTVLDYGVTDWLALNLGSSVFEPREGETQQFVSLGTSASFGKLGLLSARFLQDKDELQSQDYNYRTRLWNTSYSFNFNRAEVLSPTSGDISNRDESRATMSGQLFTGSWLPISYQNSWYRLDEKAADTRKEYFQNGIGLGTRLGYLSNSLTLHKDVSLETELDPLLNPELMQAKEDSLTGTFMYRKNFGRLHTRMFTNYEVKPTNEVYSYGGALNYTWSQSLNSELRYSHYNLTDKYQINLGLNWNKDAFYLNTNAGYNEDGSWSAGIGLRFSLGYEPLGRSVFTSGRPISQSGAAAVRVFEDLNMNGVFDVNERPIENATVKAVQAFRQEQTNESGVAVLSSLYNNTKTDIVVDESTLDGPFMITAIPGVAIKARKGYVETVELPVVKAGEVEGVIYFNKADGKNDVAPYIMLNLVDKNDAIVATTRSEYDGYYLFTNVKPGNYTLKVDESYIDRRGLKTANKQLGFSSDGDVIAGVDFVLRPLDEAKGYVAIAGQFRNTSMLKLYYHILRQRMGGSFIQQPFYIRQPEVSNHLLGLAYFPSVQAQNSTAEQQARAACAPLLVHKLNCEVQYMDFKY